jgi:hypothetical protein
MDVESSGRTVRFTADAKDFKSAVQCVQALREDPSIESASLASHEMRDDPSGAKLRFQGELVWKALQ